MKYVQSLQRRPLRPTILFIVNFQRILQINLVIFYKQMSKFKLQIQIKYVLGCDYTCV